VYVPLVVLALSIAQPEPKKELPAAPSELGADHTAFPDLKLPKPPDGAKKDDVRRYGEELSALLLKEVLPDLPKNATLLQKVQYEQVREGIAYLRTQKDKFAFNLVDASKLQELLTVASGTYQTASELQPTSAGRVRCYEQRVLLLKECERFTKARVGGVGEPPQTLNLVRYQRLQAEADLLKLKESLKGGK
jgi:hypothetical protein